MFRVFVIFLNYQKIKTSIRRIKKRHEMLTVVMIGNEEKIYFLSVLVINIKDEDGMNEIKTANVC